MLDSSPVALPPIPRPLKRSASTASLPTPPRSYRKFTRGRSRGSCESDSDEKTSSPPLTTSPPVLPKTPSSTKRALRESPPVPPKTQFSTKRALRDSPGNPFLDTESENGDDSDRSAGSYIRAYNRKERPTITYVIRGVQRECKNPLYNHAEGRPLSPPPESKLPIDHPDYSPSVRCSPKRLFSDTIKERKKEKRAAAAAAKKQKRQLSRKKARRRSSSLSDRDDDKDDDDDDDDDDEIRPLKLDFGSRKKSAAGGSSLAREKS